MGHAGRPCRKRRDAGAGRPARIAGRNRRVGFPEDLECVHALYRQCGEAGAKAYVDYLFVCRRWTGAPTNAEPDKADACRWIEAETPDGIIDFHAAMIARARAGQRFSTFQDFR